VYGVRPHGAKRAQIGRPPHTSRLKLQCLLALPWKSQGMDCFAALAMTN
jgi:hypothetical protein